MHSTRTILPFMSFMILSMALAAETPSVSSDSPSVEPVTKAQTDTRGVDRSLETPITRIERPSLPRPPQGPVPSKAAIKSLIDRLARDQALDPMLVHALIRAESSYDPQAVSPMGAVGLMQVMPETAADYGVESLDRLFDPESNLHTGMRHLKRLLGKYGAIGPAVMAYNAGEGAFERSGGFVTYAETQRYTHRVLTDYLTQKGLPPYSQQARDHIGLDLRPEMAVAGGSKTADPTMSPHLDDQNDWASEFNTGALQEPRLLRPMPQSSSLLSNRLEIASNSLLKSRLMKPKGELSVRSDRQPTSRRSMQRR
jgi:hypothetical protein